MAGFAYIGIGYVVTVFFYYMMVIMGGEEMFEKDIPRILYIFSVLLWPFTMMAIPVFIGYKILHKTENP